MLFGRPKLGGPKVLLVPLVALACAWPASGKSEPSVAALASTSTKSGTSALQARPTPTKWLPSKGRQCYGRGKYRRFCQGPRKAPMPYGAEALLAHDLGLGEVKTVSHLLLEPPKPEWIEAAGPAREEKMLWPVEDGKFWRGFGRVKRGPKRKRRHRGIDIGAPDGTPIRAAKSGLVAYADNGVRGYGNLLVTIHPDGSVAFYAHCKAIYVFPGQRMARGQIVADVGHTGIARGSHLHFEYRTRGRARNPMRSFEDAPEDALKRGR
jgi:murein DD-endopeptidase MepM/ murein hydrolase activator NlpD